MLGIFRTSEDWDAAPQQLGMSVDGYGALRGVWSGVQIVARHTTEHVTMRDSDGNTYDGQRKITEYTALFDPPLRMALGVGTRGALGRFAAWMGKKSDDGVGDPVLDAKFHTKSHDIEHARRVLSGVPARVLVEAREHYARIEVTDDAVTVTEHGWCFDLDDIRRALETVGRIAGAIQWERRAAPTAWESGVLKTWPEALTVYGLAFDPARVEGRGFCDGFYVQVKVQADVEPLCTTVSVQCSLPFAEKLRITRQQQGRVAGWFRGQDIEVGNPAFDEGFVVKGEDEAAVRALLQGEPAARLAALLAGASDLRIENDTLTVHARSLETERLGAMVGACLDAARSLRARVPGAARAPEGYR